MYLFESKNLKNIIYNIIFLFVTFTITLKSGDLAIILVLFFFIFWIWSLISLAGIVLFGYTKTVRNLTAHSFLIGQKWGRKFTQEEIAEIEEDAEDMAQNYKSKNAFEAGRGDVKTYEEMRQKRKDLASNRKLSEPSEDNDFSNNSEVKTKIKMSDDIKTYEIWVKMPNGSGPKINQKVRVQAPDPLAAVRQANATYGQDNVTQLATEVRN
jgi:ABC-type multidrug transport system fused ATPase/permease subunit